MSELKRCPFCGGLPTTEVRAIQRYGEADIINFSVVCENCGTSKTVKLKRATKIEFMDVEKSMSQTIEAWNRRADRREE